MDTATSVTDTKTVNEECPVGKKAAKALIEIVTKVLNKSTVKSYETVEKQLSLVSTVTETRK